MNASNELDEAMNALFDIASKWKPKKPSPPSSEPREPCEHKIHTGANLIEPGNEITEEMLEIAKTENLWHFAQNLNSLMKHGYCKKCKLTPRGCRREGCM